MLYLTIIISSIFVNNIVLSQIIGICPFMGVSKKIDTALGMGGAVAFVMVLATIVTSIVQKYALVPFGIEYLQTISFILIIAALVQLVEILLKKVAPPLYQALGVYLPLISTNCAILGIAIMTIQKEYNLFAGTIYAFASAAGFSLAMVIFAGIREQLDMVNVPKGMKGVPIALVTAGILAMAFMGFAGIA